MCLIRRSFEYWESKVKFLECISLTNWQLHAKFRQFENVNRLISTYVPTLKGNEEGIEFPSSKLILKIKWRDCILVLFLKYSVDFQGVSYISATFDKKII